MERYLAEEKQSNLLYNIILIRLIQTYPSNLLVIPILQVSIYGHSLGSVLSYDILCHQETLTSPFPMEWMYKEQKRNNIPISVRSNITSSNTPNSNSRYESSEYVLSESMVGLLHCPDLLEEPMEGTSNRLGPPASSESDVSSLGGHTDELFHSSYDMEFNKTDQINDANTMRTDAVPCADSIENSHSSKAEKIRLLMEEVISGDLSLCCLSRYLHMILIIVPLSQKDLLKAKVKEFEADYDGKGMDIQFHCSLKCCFGLYMFVLSVLAIHKHQCPVFDKNSYQRMQRRVPQT